VRLRTVLRFANPRYVWRGRTGACPVCDRRTFFLVTSAPDQLRNDAFCVRCGSIARQRHLALAILDAFRDRGIRALSDFSTRPDLALWHTAARGPVARALTHAASIVVTEFFDDVPSGATRDGILCQDVQAPTFDDGRFDLVITEDVLEHVPDWREALRQIHRVLKPGGCHVFTVPYRADQRTRTLFERRGGGWQPIGPVEYHEDPIRGRIATYTRFGSDFADEMSRLGFSAGERATTPDEVTRCGTYGCTSWVAARR
jgi:hypothetical protein